MCSIMLSILALLYGAAALTGVQAECQTTAEGYTWIFQADRDEMLLDVPSAEACLSSCFNDPDCSGYTWLTDVVVDICYKFQVLEGQHTCYGCHSGTVPIIFHEEACKEDASHLIAVVTADSSDSCYTACMDTEKCTAFTWYNQLTSLPYYCFLYGECVDTIPCLGCSSGLLNCIGQTSTTASPTITTSTTTTTTTTTSTTTTITTTSTTSTTTRSGDWRIKLEGGVTPNEGNVLLWDEASSEYKNVCDDLWEKVEAIIACNMLGYSTGNATKYSTWGVADNILFDNFECSGTEEDLYECEYITDHNCDESEGAGVICS